MLGGQRTQSLLPDADQSPKGRRRPETDSSLWRTASSGRTAPLLASDCKTGILWGLEGLNFFYFLLRCCSRSIGLCKLSTAKERKEHPCHVCHVLLVFPFYPPSWVLLEWTLLCFCFPVIWKFCVLFLVSCLFVCFTNFNKYFYLNINNYITPHPLARQSLYIALFPHLPSLAPQPL